MRGEVEGNERELLVEVAVSYRGVVLEVVHVREGAGDGFVIGEGPGVDLTLAADDLPDDESFTLVHADDLGCFWLEFTPAMRGAVSADGRTRSLDEFARAGASAVGGHLRVALPAGARAFVERGDLRLSLRTVRYEAPVLSPAPADRLMWACTLVTAAICVALLALMASIPPQLLALDTARLRPVDPTRYVLAEFVEPAEPTTMHRHRARPGQPIADDQLHPGDDPHDRESGLSRSRERSGSAGAAGQAGSRDGPRAVERERWPAPREFRRSEGDPAYSASSAGILGLAGPYMQAFADASPGAYRPEVDDHGLWDSMMELDSVGEAYGVGGLGLVGSGRGTGGTGEGVIGLGNSGLIAHGGGQPYRPHGCLGCPDSRRKPKEWIPRLHVGAAEATQDYPITSVRKVIRDHSVELVSCYARALRRNPTLEGSVTMGFVISANGRVGLATTDTSELRDRQFERCMALAIQRWTFPAPAQGRMVMVEQRFVFDSDRHR